MTRSTRRCLGAILTVWLFVAPGVPATLADADPREVRIAIQSRAFQPAEVTVQAGQEAVLRFDNHDVEIHAFVPEQWLEQVPVEVGGSGAPFFGDKGLTRVVIPGGGQATLQFVPRIPGTYRYWCDMPGHQMDGHIRMEQSTAPSGVVTR